MAVSPYLYEAPAGLVTFRRDELGGVIYDPASLPSAGVRDTPPQGPSGAPPVYAIPSPPFSPYDTQISPQEAQQRTAIAARREAAGLSVPATIQNGAPSGAAGPGEALNLGYNPSQYGTPADAGELAGYLGGQVRTTNFSSGGGANIPQAYLVSVGGVDLNVGLLAERYRMYPKEYADRMTQQELSSNGVAWQPAPAPPALYPTTPGKVPTTVSPGSEATATSPSLLGAPGASQAVYALGNPVNIPLRQANPEKPAPLTPPNQPMAARPFIAPVAGRVQTQTGAATAISPGHRVTQRKVSGTECAFCERVHAEGPGVWLTAFFPPRKRRAA